MIIGFRRDGGFAGLRPWVAGGALIVGAVTSFGCGSTSDDGTYSAAARPLVPVAKVARHTAAAVPKGYVRLGALRLGTPGKLVVSPKGRVPGPGTEHWFKRGTKVTIRAKDTKTANFAEWSGDCRGKKRTCTVRMTRNVVGVAGFTLDKAGAKGLKKSDGRLKVVISD